MHKIAFLIAFSNKYYNAGTKPIYYSKMNNIQNYLNGIFKYYYLWRNNVEKYKEISNVARQIATNFDLEIILPKIEELFKIVYDSY
jgi:GH25 family lysozyme M1 (1,4-beta-N-acetylmuramidase)